MVGTSNLEIHDLQFLTEEELRDVVAVFTTKQSALSQREADILDEADRWTKHLGRMMTRGCLPLGGAPPSAFILMQFPRLMELCFEEESRNSDPLFARRWQDMLNCLCTGLQDFQVEAFDGVEIDEAWVSYYDYNLNRVKQLFNRLNRCGEGIAGDTVLDSQ